MTNKRIIIRFRKGINFFEKMRLFPSLAPFTYTGGELVRTEKEINDFKSNEKRYFDSYEKSKDNEYENAMFRTFTLECKEEEVDKFISELRKQDSDIEHIQKNNSFELHSDRSSEIEHRLNQINCLPEAWTISTGEGIIVAVIDTGAHYPHDDIETNIWGTALYQYGVNMITNNPPYDLKGHGTHVAGIIGALKQGNPEGIIGIAPSAKIMVIKAFDDTETSISEEKAISAINFAVANQAKVINLSWGIKMMSGEVDNDYFLLNEAITNAVNNFVTVICSAGNNKANIRDFVPQNHRDIICVGALQIQLDKRWSYSNYGKGVHVSAPGVDVLSLKNADFFYIQKTGTSMSAPQVSGLAALMLSKNNTLTPQQVKKMIIKYADKITTDKPIGKKINVLNTLKNTPLP